jgi:capsular exopolysaccharide synthesis family protein
MADTNQNSFSVELSKTMRNRKIFIVSVTIISVLLSFIYLNSSLNGYDAKATILVHADSRDIGLLNAHMQNEANKIASPAMAKTVITSLKLDQDPEFSKSQQKQQNIIDTILTGQETGNFKQFSIRGLSEENEDLKIFYEKPKTSALIRNFLNKLDVQQTENSSILNIRYNSEDPAKAILITNTIADLYVQKSQPDYYAARSKRAEQLRMYNQRLKKLKSELEKSKSLYLEAAQALEVARSENAGQFQENNEQVMAELGKQLIRAKALEAEALAKLDMIKKGHLPKSIAASKSKVLNALKIKEAEILQDMASLSQRYGSKHPKIKATENALETVRQQIASELKIVQSHINENLELASTRVSFLEDMQSRLQALSPNSNIVVEIEYAERERDYNQAQASLNSFIKLVEKPEVQILGEDVQTTKVLSYAAPALSIDRFYQQIPVLLMTAFWALIIATFIAYVREKSIKTFRTVEELEEETKRSCLGLVPERIGQNSTQSSADFIISKDGHRTAEAVRTLQMVLRLRAQNHAQKAQVITMTSSLPDEGKTTLSTWMARTAAKAGQKVIVIDCDLRRPRLHEAFGKKPQNTIVEYLTGKCTLDEALYRDPPTNMHAMFGRSVPHNALDLINNGRMEKLILSLREKYDLIILDSPACLSVSDARLLASKSDQLLYVVSWNDTRREVVNAGLKQFADFGYDAVTLVLNNVDLKRYAEFDFNDAVHYYSAYNPYYTD